MVAHTRKPRTSCNEDVIVSFYNENTLHQAVENGDKEKVKILIKEGADINGRDDESRSALYLAADQRFKEILESLIKAGADVNAAGGEYGNALQAAAQYGGEELVEILIKAGADVNAAGGFYGSALQAATCHGSKEVVEILIKAGADINAVSGYYGNALQAAATYGSKELVESLIKAGADINAVGGYYGSALQAAATYGSKELMESLIKAGADINAAGGYYGSALQAAANQGSKEVVEILIKAGADINTAGGYYGSALQAAVTNASERKDLIRLLLGNPVSINLQSRASDGSCLLHAAVASRDHEILNSLFKAGAETIIDVKDVSGRTPVQLAVMSGNLQILETFYTSSKHSKKIFEEMDADGRTSLHLAVENKAVDVVRWLLDRDVRADVRDFGDSTPFQQAFQTKSFEILSLLFPKTTEDGELLSASQWRSVQSEDFNKIIVMTSGKVATVETMSSNQLPQYINERSYSLTSLASEFDRKKKSMAEDTPEKRMILLADESILGSSLRSGVQWRWWRQTRQKDRLGRIGQKWIPQFDKVPSAVTIRQISSGECFLECRLALPVFSLTDWRELPESLKNSFKCLKNLHAIIWIMVKPEPSTTEPKTRQSILETKTFFSTLEYAAVPSTPTDLFVPLVRQLQDEWIYVCEAADEHLSAMHTKVLKSSGIDSKLIKFLLRDARLWGVLSKLLEVQIKTLKSLQGSYESKTWTVLHEKDKDKLEKKIKDFRDEIESLSLKVQKLLGNLIATSQTQIQLEFNLTSIAEAQKSTSMNRSVKRLSWITFIFLPLTFIGTLFGMNVNILQSNPSWWLYLPFAIGTTTLTMVVWIAFKRSENLENQIEGKFRWLLRKKTRDVEEGLERGPDRSEMWKLKRP